MTRKELAEKLLAASKQAAGYPVTATLTLSHPEVKGFVVTNIMIADLLRAAEHMTCDAREIADLQRYLDTPELHDFAKGAVAEAQHQRKRWGAEHDAGKSPEDWFWLIGYLAGKALHAAKTGDHDKALHHTISTAAVLANWHAALTGADNSMRPGIDRARAEGAA